MAENAVAEASYPQTERRSSSRYDFCGEIEIDLGSRKIWGRTTNISRSGMFIELPDGLDLGSIFFGNLALHNPLRIECRVRRIVPGRGVGVSIVLACEEERLRYEALLAALAPASRQIAAASEAPQKEDAEKPLGRLRWISQDTIPDAAS